MYSMVVIVNDTILYTWKLWRVDLRRSYIQMAIRYMKTCSLSLSIRQIQIKTMKRHHLTPVRTVKINNTGKKRWWWAYHIILLGVPNQCLKLTQHCMSIISPQVDKKYTLKKREREISRPFSQVAVSFRIPKSSVWKFQLLHVLVNGWFSQFLSPLPFESVCWGSSSWFSFAFP